MKSTLAQLTARFDQALVAAFGPDLAGTDPMLVPTTSPKFGDYQANLAMSLAKPLKQKPRDIATQIVEKLDLSDLCEPPEIAGPGFINLHLKTEYLEDQIRAMQADSRLGVEPVKTPQKVIVDFSSPNIAKEMHVGHLRSTIIGDSIARVQEFMGHDVLRLNHVGDWGTQFGMLVTFLLDLQLEALGASKTQDLSIALELTNQLSFGDQYKLAIARAVGKNSSPTMQDLNNIDIREMLNIDIGDLVTFYRQAKQLFDVDDNFKRKSREAVVALQAGDETVRTAWAVLCDQSRKEFQKLYDRLDITIQERGESFYNPLLSDVVTDLEALGLLVEDQGAQVVFADGFTNKDGDPLPLIIQKTDGGYNYATTDLAAIRYRTQQDGDGADRILYVVDAGQGNHFAQVFQVAAKAEWIPQSVELTHVPFGVVQGEDGKKFKTRSGDTVKLKDLLDEAVSRARTDLETRIQTEEREETEDFIQDVAEAVGIGSVKYADLSQNRTSNYIFSFDKMLAMAGNTAPYMLYAYVRVQGIARKGGIDLDNLPAEARIHLDDGSELTLARHLLQLDEVLGEVAQDLYPSRLCQYLFELSQKFNQFYDRCSVLQTEEPQRTSRLLLCDLTAKTLKLGLSLLGIRVLERM